MTQPRASGILLHPTSLPGPHGLGDLGRRAYEFVDFLVAGGVSLWQILPLGPTGYGDSPYSAFSAFAGNPLLISLEALVACGDLETQDIAGAELEEGRADFAAARELRKRLLPHAARTFFDRGTAARREAFDAFCLDQAHWLEDYVLFRSLRRQFQEQSWDRWPDEVRRREAAALNRWREELVWELAVVRYAQFVFFEQWFALKAYANEQGVRLIGDLPIFVAPDSADVWSRPDLFHLDDNQRPTRVAGVPPDYFSATGQRWGNPLYRWERLAEENFGWWKERLRWTLSQTDRLRIDHFRGFCACWAIPAEETTATRGEWMPVPGEELFAALQDTFGELPLIAEDLGIINEEVEALRDRFGLPGMKILQFAFDSGPDNPYLPHNLPRNCLVYTGTHDNATTLGWWRDLAEPARRQVVAYLGRENPQIPWDLIHLAIFSVADSCILPLQDVLGCDDRARMNRPGHPENNWSWRYLPEDLAPELAARLREMNRISGRCRDD